MKIKQQKQIKKFLIEKFGIDKGNIVFIKQEEILNEIIKNIKGKSENHRKTLIQTILPSFDACKEYGYPEFCKVFCTHEKYFYLLF